MRSTSDTKTISLPAILRRVTSMFLPLYSSLVVVSVSGSTLIDLRPGVKRYAILILLFLRHWISSLWLSGRHCYVFVSCKFIYDKVLIRQHLIEFNLNQIDSKKID